MRQGKFYLCLVAFYVLMISFVACSEEKAPGEYDGWEARNETYLNEIATTAKTNSDGHWEILLAYNLGRDTTSYLGQNKYFVYVYKKEIGTGRTPLFTDSVRVHYEGRLIPSQSYANGLVFDKSYSGDTLNEQTDVPSLMNTGGAITGFATALLHMKEGDRWDVIIPQYLGYKGTAQTKIPAYSTLRFDVKLAKVYRLGIDNNTDWR